MEIKEFEGFNSISEEELEDVNGGGSGLKSVGYGIGYVVGKLCEGWGHVHG